MEPIRHPSSQNDHTIYWDSPAEHAHGQNSTYPTVSVHQAYSDFTLYNRAARLTAKSQSFYECQLAPFVRYCHAHAIDSVGAITPVLVRAYLISLEDRQLSDYSVHAAARAIRAFLNFCVREEHIAVSPMARVAMPRVNKRILPAFSEDDVHRLIAGCDTKRDRALVLFLLDTGCRVSELVNLNGGDVNLRMGEVQIRKGKGGKGRSVFLGQAARDSLLAYYGVRGVPDEQAPVWLSQTRRKRLTLSGLQQLLKRLGRLSGVKHCSAHTFRRTFAITCLRNGMDIFRLARLMGHSDIGVLRQYLYLVKDDLRSAHAQFGSVDKLLARQAQSEPGAAHHR